MPADVKEVMEIVPCSRVEDALAAAFDPPLLVASEALAPLARL